MYPNSALPVWQLVVMTSVAVASLALWIIVVCLASREGGGCSCPGYDSLSETEVTVGSTAEKEERWNADQRAA